MTADEFMKQQYLTLRDEIRASKARIFTLVIMGTVLIPAAGFAANSFAGTYAAASMPFLILVLMLAFVMEQSSIIRAGRYLREHVEPHLENLTTWETWLESNKRFRETDRYFFGTFLIVFLLFYTLGAVSAVQGWASSEWAEHTRYAVAAYGIGGVWFIVVLLGHWKMCTRTT